MKKRELMEIIRVVVRKELKEILPTIVNECVDTLSTIPEQVETDPVELTKQVLRTNESKTKKIRYTQDEVLNNILNETKGGVPQEKSSPSAPGLNIPETQVDFNGNEVEVDALPESISSALTRDYSELMGAIDKKKGGVS